MSGVRVRAFAKINLCLEVLNKRSDGFHNLRTIFQTISLRDMLGIEVRRARHSRVSVKCNVEIPGENLVVRAAEALLAKAGISAQVSFDLQKRIPMGGGLGGGSADAGAVLMTLPRLLGVSLAWDEMLEIGSALGSDVPFFLMGGTALGLGRGTELYPLPDCPTLPGLLVAPPVHVSTAEAYKALRRSENAPPNSGISGAEQLAAAIVRGSDWTNYCVNDFEEAVFPQHPSISAIRASVEQSGARTACMTGSGAAVFGLFVNSEERQLARRRLENHRVFPFSFVPRRRYLEAFSMLG